MDRYRSAVVSTAALILVSCAAFPSAAQDFGGLDGSWEGTLTNVQGPGWFFPATQPTKKVKLVIQGNSAQAFQVRDDKFVEIKPGKFKVERVKTNAIVFAVDTGSDSDGTWVQNWLYAVTEKDRGTLIVNFYAMANNLNMPLSNSSSKWTTAATGELKRVK